jgi:hypothetical protein
MMLRHFDRPALGQHGANTRMPDSPRPEQLGVSVLILRKIKDSLSNFPYVFFLIVPYFTCYHFSYENDSHYHNNPRHGSGNRNMGRDKTKIGKIRPADQCQL